MAIFFKSQAASPALRNALQKALETDPTQVPDPPGQAALLAQLTREAAPPRELSRPMLALAVLLLGGLLAAGLYAGMQVHAHPELKQWSDALFHAFQIVLGLVLGALGGEAAAHS
jgi:hypothetical protein